jgi:hypothetical protein
MARTVRGAGVPVVLGAGRTEGTLIHSMSIVQTTDREHVFVCACGYESLPRQNPFDAMNEQCEVLAAEVVGARRRALRKAREKRAAA